MNGPSASSRPGRGQRREPARGGDGGGVDAVIAVPVYAGGEHLREALTSLRAQTYTALRILLVDDGPGSRETVHDLMEADPRIVYVANEQRLGLAGNWQRCFAEARARWPQARFFAWGSDHDLWAPEWLATLIAALEAEPQAVLAYPDGVTIFSDGCARSKPDRTLDTRGVSGSLARLRAAYRSMWPGHMVYGLYRGDALAMTSFRRVLLPDRLLLAELSLRGAFVHVPSLLFTNRYTGAASYARQRQAIFVGRRPWWNRLHWLLTHQSEIAGRYLLRVAPDAKRGRVTGARVTLVHLGCSVGFVVGKFLRDLYKSETVKRKRETVKRLRRRRRLAVRRVRFAIGRKLGRGPDTPR